jgi:hypothetical protein
MTPSGYILPSGVYGTDGQRISPYVIRLKKSEVRQTEPNSLPKTMMDFEATGEIDGVKTTWPFTVSKAEFENNFAEAMARFLPEFDPGGAPALKNAILGILNEPESWPTRAYDNWMDESGLYAHGKQLTNFAVTVVGEDRGSYRLRTQLPGEPPMYFLVSHMDLHLTNWAARVGIGARMTDQVTVGMELTKAWKRATPLDRRGFQIAELAESRMRPDADLRRIDNQIRELKQRPLDG